MRYVLLFGIIGSGSNAFSFAPKTMRARTIQSPLSSLERSKYGTAATTSIPSSLSSSATDSSNNMSHDCAAIPKDVVIIGAGLAGLSVAFHIAQQQHRNDQPHDHEPPTITVLDREDPFQQKRSTTAGSFAAAGMLAPNGERLPDGPLLDLCLQSRDMYPAFVREIEAICRNCSTDAQRYLWNGTERGAAAAIAASNNGPGPSKPLLEPWQVGYSSTGGFLAPAFAGDSVATWSPPDTSVARWLDDVQVHEMEPQLHSDVVGGWWFPEDSSVDARRLTCALRAACVEKGVEFLTGEGYGAASLELRDGTCKEVRLDNGKTLHPKSIVVANGAWMRNLLPVPITPHKGQSLSLMTPPPPAAPLLQRVLFAQDTYIVPKPDGRIIIGATVEAGTFDPHVTPAGLMHCIGEAVRLVPALRDLPVDETWVGMRPTTPDKGPIVGHTEWDNLFLAGGYWRNGVLLAPKGGQLVGDLVLRSLGKDKSPQGNDGDEALVKTFGWERFKEKGGGKKLAANARYAASMHPVQQRSTGVGVSAAVGTELGFYSGAEAAVDERRKDRDSLFRGFGDDGGVEEEQDGAFERAASLGVRDSTAFSFDGEPFVSSGALWDEIKVDGDENSLGDDDERDDNDNGNDDINTVDISHMKMNDEVLQAAPTETQDTFEGGPPSTTFDGYTSIQSANSRGTRSEELLVMKQARISNRLSVSKIDESRIGVKKRSPVEDRDDTEDTPTDDDNDISKIYAKIRDNKRSAGSDGDGEVEMMPDTTSDESRPDPGFRIYRVDHETKERRMVPPYTSPQDMEAMIAAEKRVVAPSTPVPNGAEASKVSADVTDSNTGNDEEDTAAMYAKIRVQDRRIQNRDEDISKIYAKIRDNKRAVGSDGDGEVEMMPDTTSDESRPDPGFRIHRVDHETRERRMVPPYTSPQEMEEMIAAEKKEKEHDNKI